MEYYDEEAVCACRKGIVTRRCYVDENDWSTKYRYTAGDILCPECKKKYHAESITRKGFVYPWEGSPFYTEEYLVPNGMEVPEMVVERFSFGCGVKEKIVNISTKQELMDVIRDMEHSKYSTRIALQKSKEIVDICRKELKIQSLKKIIPMLQDILNHYDEYEWNPDTIKAFKEEESKIIRKYKEDIKKIISLSYKLDFYGTGICHSE